MFYPVKQPYMMLCNEGQLFDIIVSISPVELYESIRLSHFHAEALLSWYESLTTLFPVSDCVSVPTQTKLTPRVHSDVKCRFLPWHRVEAVLCVSERVNNFPPLPKFMRIKPCFYHNIEEEIPAPHQQLVRRIYTLWMSECVSQRSSIKLHTHFHPISFTPSSPRQCTRGPSAWTWSPVSPGGLEEDRLKTLACLFCGSSSSAPVVTPAGSDHSTKLSGGSSSSESHGSLIGTYFAFRGSEPSQAGFWGCTFRTMMPSTVCSSAGGFFLNITDDSLSCDTWHDLSRT